MFILAPVLIACIMFAVGFLVGARKEPTFEKLKLEVKKDEDLKRLQKEYENFLNYDGSVQE